MQLGQLRAAPFEVLPRPDVLGNVVVDGAATRPASGLAASWGAARCAPCTSHGRSTRFLRPNFSSSAHPRRCGLARLIVFVLFHTRPDRRGRVRRQPHRPHCGTSMVGYCLDALPGVPRPTDPRDLLSCRRARNTRNSHPAMAPTRRTGAVDPRRNPRHVGTHIRYRSANRTLAMMFLSQAWSHARQDGSCPLRSNGSWPPIVPRPSHPKSRHAQPMGLPRFCPQFDWRMCKGGAGQNTPMRKYRHARWQGPNTESLQGKT